MSEMQSGVVTTADLYRKLGDISDSMIRMEERVSVLPDHEARLRMLEKFRYSLMGAAVLAGTSAGIISALLTQRR